MIHTTRDAATAITELPREHLTLTLAPAAMLLMGTMVFLYLLARRRQPKRTLLPEQIRVASPDAPTYNSKTGPRPSCWEGRRPMPRATRGMPQKRTREPQP